MQVNLTLTTAQLTILSMLVERAREDDDTTEWLGGGVKPIRDENGEMVDIPVQLSMLARQLGKWVPR